MPDHGRTITGSADEDTRQRIAAIVSIHPSGLANISGQLLTNEGDQIKGRRRHLGLGKQPVRPSAVMRLLVEEVPEHKAERRFEPVAP
jgi:hypothetical protein